MRRSVARSPWSFAWLIAAVSFVIRLLLLRLVRAAVGVKQLHQLPPELAHFGGFPGGEFLLLRQRRRRLRIFLLLLRARLPVFLRDLPGLFLALPHERFQMLPTIADPAKERDSNVDHFSRCR